MTLRMFRADAEHGAQNFRQVTATRMASALFLVDKPCVAIATTIQLLRVSNYTFSAVTFLDTSGGWVLHLCMLANNGIA